MKIIDCHVHVSGKIDVKSLLRKMDANRVERLILLSQYEKNSIEKSKEYLETTIAAVKEAPDRLSALARIEPTITGIGKLVDNAINNMGYKGIKIIPNHWFIYEKRLEPFWEEMDRLQARILFHTGIIYAFDDNSRFTQPHHLEKLLHYPNIKFAMAHISWPWCEECLAVMGRMRAAAGYVKNKWQSYVDLTPGTPPHIRFQAVKNAVEFCGVDRLMFGTDQNTANGHELSNQKKIIENDLLIFEKIGLDKQDQERIMSGTAIELFNI